MEYAVRTEQLQKAYKNQKVLDHVCMHVEKGAIYGLIGRNGAGKTTLMKMITGMAYPTAGDIYLFGENTKTDQKNQMRLGNLIENPGLYPGMTAFENMRLQAVAMGVYRKETVYDLLDLVGLGDVGGKKVKNFSMGMKQRLGIGIALIGSPDMLILDEPINGLDPQGIIEIRELLMKLNRTKNMTVIISSHILDELSRVATKYGIINSGELMMELTEEELREKCAEKVEIITTDVAHAEVVLESMGIRDFRVVDSRTIEAYSCVDRSAEINTKMVMEGVLIQSIQIKSDTLQEFFLKATSGQKEGK